MIRHVAASSVLASLLVSIRAHGFVTDPRSRGSLYLPRIIKAAGLEHLVKEADVGGNVGWEDCPHCSNGGGVNVLKGFAPGGKFEMFEPLKGKFRKGLSFCGDKPGSNDHSPKGKYGAPASLPFVASYKAGGVANFQFDLNTPHGGYLEFYLCDVSVSGDISEASFNDGDCYLLERAVNEDCESGTFKHKCGPIDPKYTSRWYLPCRESDKQFQNQIVGGSDGSMSYKVPNIAMTKAVVHVYWMTSNSCNPRGHTEYFQSGVWPAVEGCPGDGSTSGGYNDDHAGDCDTQPGKWPEEFMNCADVEIVGGGAKMPRSAEEQAADLVATKTPVETTVSINDATISALSTSTGQKMGENGATISTETVSEPVETPEPKPETLRATDGKREGTARPATKEPRADFELRSGCMPQFDEYRSDNAYYMSYYKQLQQYCKSEKIVSKSKGLYKPYGSAGASYLKDANENTGKVTELEQGAAPQAEFEVRKNCMPSFDAIRSNDAGYLSYWRQMQDHCKAV